MKHLFHAMALVAILFLAACNMPSAQPTPALSLNEQAGTMVAATLTGSAPLPSTASAVTPFASPAIPTVTATTKPSFTVNTANAECRSGPGPDAKLVATFALGTKVDLAGKDTADSYYIVVDPTSHNLCWIEAQYGTPSGSYSSLLEVTPPASPASQKVPPRPGFVSYNFSCEFGGGGMQVKVDLKWPDTATNEKGYYVYRDGSQIADLPVNSTTYSETVGIPSGTVFSYGVAAYNDIGTSAQAVTHGDPITCQ